MQLWIIEYDLCGERNKDTVQRQGQNEKVVGLMDSRFHLDQSFWNWDIGGSELERQEVVVRNWDCGRATVIRSRVWPWQQVVENDWNGIKELRFQGSTWKYDCRDSELDDKLFKDKWARVSAYLNQSNIEEQFGKAFHQFFLRARILNLESIEGIVEFPESSEIVSNFFSLRKYVLFKKENPWLSLGSQTGLISPNTKTTTEA